MKTAAPIMVVVYFVEKRNSLDFSFFIMFYTQDPTVLSRSRLILLCIT